MVPGILEPIKLAEVDTIVPTGAVCSVIGRGASIEPHYEGFDGFDLKRVEVPIADYNLCKQSYEDTAWYSKWNLPIGPENMCAGDFDKGGKGGRFAVASA